MWWRTGRRSGVFGEGTLDREDLLVFFWFGGGGGMESFLWGKEKSGVVGVSNQ